MKRKALISVLLVVVMAVSLMLTGCSGGKRVFDDSGDITMTTEHEVYGGDIQTIGCIIENNTDKTVSFGENYELEKLEEEEWTAMAAEGLVFRESLTDLEGGKKFGFAVKADAFGGSLADGTYRVVKQIGEKFYAAEFEVGASEITAETPFGMASFDSVPADYSAEAALSDGCAVVGDETDLSAMYAFVEKATIGLPAMVRMAEYNDGELKLTDIVYDGEGYTYKVRTDDTVSEHKYPFVFTDDTAVYLSDCVSNGYFSSFPDAVRIPVLTADQTDITQLAAAVKELTRATLTGDSTVYKCYSPDGARYIRVKLENSIVKEHTDKLRYIVGTPDGEKEYASDDSEGLANQITLAEWLDDSRVILSFKTVYGINYFETRNTAKDEVERHSYSESYFIEDGTVNYIG